MPFRSWYLYIGVLVVVNGLFFWTFPTNSHIHIPITILSNQFISQYMHQVIWMPLYIFILTGKIFLICLELLVFSTNTEWVKYKITNLLVTVGILINFITFRRRKNKTKKKTVKRHGMITSEQYTCSFYYHKFKKLELWLTVFAACRYFVFYFYIIYKSKRLTYTHKEYSGTNILLKYSEPFSWKLHIWVIFFNYL